VHLILPPPHAVGAAGDLLAGSYTGDAGELMEGAHRVLVVPLEEPQDGRPTLPAGTLSGALGVPLDPWLSAGDRLRLLQGPGALAQELLRVLGHENAGAGAGAEAAAAETGQTQE
jgi:hypothetical protein